MFENVKSYYKKHAKWVPLVFFSLGFIFDAVMLRRIDDLFAMVSINQDRKPWLVPDDGGDEIGDASSICADHRLQIAPLIAVEWAQQVFERLIDAELHASDGYDFQRLEGLGIFAVAQWALLGPLVVPKEWLVGKRGGSIRLKKTSDMPKK